MWANMKAAFVIDGPRIHLERDRSGDRRREDASRAARSTPRTGPNQSYQVQSRVHFPRMRELFFKNETWQVTGDGDFNGVFKLFKAGADTNRDLTGTFSSALAGVNDYRFPSLYGSLRWTQHAFEVWNAGSRVLRRRREVRLLDQAVRREDEADPSLRRDRDRRRPRAVHRLPAVARPAVCRRRDAAQRARLAVGTVLRAPRRGAPGRDAAARRDADVGVARRRARGGRGPHPPRVGAVCAAAAAARTCRSRPS